MLKVLIVVLFSVTNCVLGNLDFHKLANDCVKNTLDGPMKQFSIKKNLTVHNLRNGSSTFHCLTYNRDGIEDSFDIFTIKLIPQYTLHYVSICNLNWENPI